MYHLDSKQTWKGMELSLLTVMLLSPTIKITSESFKKEDLSNAKGGKSPIRPKLLAVKK